MVASCNYVVIKHEAARKADVVPVVPRVPCVEPQCVVGPELAKDVLVVSKSALVSWRLSCGHIKFII